MLFKWKISKEWVKIPAGHKSAIGGIATDFEPTIEKFWEEYYKRSWESSRRTGIVNPK
jgi:hypothetical protein